jgi:hypothetical protein
LLAGQQVNDIYIDATGNKWISTNDGLWVISLDGTELLARYTKDNTPLPENAIQGVVINPNNGICYIGMSNGLYTAQSTILKPAENYDIKAYPQPFNVVRDENVIIEGLTTNSDIRIVTPDGQLIRSLETSSKRAVWDGRDDKGDIVPAGVYIVISSSDIANTSGAGKIAVVE